MKRRSITWPIVALIFTLANIGGAVYAAAMGEMPHAGLHVVLTFAGAWVTWLLFAGRRTISDVDMLVAPTPSGEIGTRLSNLEQSLDAIAVEVERVGEGQRYMTKVFSERGTEKDRPK